MVVAQRTHCRQPPARTVGKSKMRVFGSLLPSTFLLSSLRNSTAPRESRPESISGASALTPAPAWRLQGGARNCTCKHGHGHGRQHEHGRGQDMDEYRLISMLRQPDRLLLGVISQSHITVCSWDLENKVPTKSMAGCRNFERRRNSLMQTHVCM